MLSKINSTFKELRMKASVTQEQMAIFLGLEQSSISKFENGERTLSVGHLEKACTLFGVHYYELLNDSSNIVSLAPSFRKAGIGALSLEAISEINKIALNLMEMDKISGK